MADRKKPKKRSGGRRAEAPNRDAFVTIAQYGLDDQTVTKVVATVFRHPRDKNGKMLRWVGTNITESVTMRKELVQFIKNAGARKVVLTRGVIGCIHEEGKDYPKGEDCPFCLFWKGRDRFAGADPVIMKIKAFDDDEPWPG